MTSTQDGGSSQTSQGRTHPLGRFFVVVLHESSWLMKSARRISIMTSVGSAFLIWFLFIHLRGWTPPPGEEALYARYFDFGVMAILWIQISTLSVTSNGGNRVEIVIDTLTTFLPLAFIVYVLLLYIDGYEALPREQWWNAWMTFMATSLDLVADLGVILLAQARLSVGPPR